MTHTLIKSWRSLAGAVAVFAAAGACSSGSISGGGDKPVAGLRFTVQPTGAAAGANFNVSVELLDATGAKIGNADDVVTLTVSGGASLVGTATAPAVNGLATFTGLSVTKSGTGYTISATANGVSASSSSFTITPGAATAAQSGATYNPTNIVAGATIAVTFTFKDQYGNPIPGKTVTLSSSLAGVTFTPSTGTTSATGTFTTNMVATGAGTATVSATVDGVSISLPTAVTITAPATYTITTSSNPANGGTTTGGGTFTQGASVTVTATAANGFTFTNWTEGATAVSTNASYQFTAGANRTLVANFAAAIPCTPVALTFPGNANGTVSAATGCTAGTFPASIFQFTTAISGGHTFSATSTAFADPAIAVTTNPPGTTQAGWTTSTGTVIAEWILPVGTYRLRVVSNTGSSGPFSITGTATDATTNNCLFNPGVPPRTFLVGGTYTGQSLGTGDCVFAGDGGGQFVDIFFIRSPQACTITLTPTGFDAVLEARNGDLDQGLVAPANAGGIGVAETISLPGCNLNQGTIGILPSAANPGATGTYTLTITLTGAGAGGTAGPPAFMLQDPDSAKPLSWTTLGRLTRIVPTGGR